MSNQEIKCKVGSCRFNSNNHHCTLNEITVGCETLLHEPQSEHETVCASFSPK